MKVVLTGFGPFPGVPHNISSDLARHCAEAWSRDEGVDASFVGIATEWQTAPDAIQALLLNEQPDILLHLGVSEQATNLVLENRAYNGCCATEDAAGATASMRDRENNSIAEIETSVDVEVVGQRLRQSGHAVTNSQDPGRYLCNAVYYKTLTTLAQNGLQTKALFVHIPTTFSTDTLSQDEAIAGMRIVFDVLSAD